MRAPAKTFVRAGRLRRAMTLPEVQLWQALRRLGVNGPRFRRQHPIGPYVLDFYAPVAKLAVAVDGAAHDIPIQVKRDVSRDAWLRARGIGVLRFNAPDILDPRCRDGPRDHRGKSHRALIGSKLRQSTSGGRRN